MDGIADTELRTYTPTELGFLVSTFRQAHGWSQETLAELAGVTARTVQRVEASEPSSLDTRRALARAFGLDAIDAFSSPKEFVTPEGAARAKADFDRRFLVIETEPRNGRALTRDLVVGAPFRAIHSGMIGEPPHEVEDLYAAVLDYLQDLMDVADVATNVQLLEYADEVERMLAKLRAQGWELAVGRRLARLGRTLPCALFYAVLVPAGGGNRKIAVLKELDGSSLTCLVKAELMADRDPKSGG